jgi:hypothetical protein
MQTLQNPYLVQKLANATGTNIEIQHPYAHEPRGHVLLDNRHTQDVEVLAERRLSPNTTTHILRASTDIEYYPVDKQAWICELMISSFNGIFQPIQEDLRTWEAIDWEISKTTANANILEATGTGEDGNEDAYFFYLEFFTREGEPNVIWLRVHYEGPTAVYPSYDTTQNTPLS